MNRVWITWLLGSFINLILIWYLIVGGFFSQRMIIPTIWITINFIPISVILSYTAFKQPISRIKYLLGLLITFLILCLASIYSRNFLNDYESFVQIIKYSPFVLLPLQGVIFFILIRANQNLSPLGDIQFSSQNKDIVIQFIQKGETIRALDILLEESKNQDEAIFKYISLLKYQFKVAKRQNQSFLIKRDDFLMVEANVNQSILDLLA